MAIVYAFFVLFCVLMIRDAVKAIKQKRPGDILPYILLFPFAFCFLLGVLSGGSALNDARDDYELYQAGHYYLESHGNWTEVSYQRYLFVLVSEIIGFASLILTFVLCIIRDAKRKRKTP